MREYILKSFEFANSLTTQLITLSSVLIGISVTFVEKFDIKLNIWLLIISWSTLFLSILCGILTLMALAGTIGKATETEVNNNSVNIYGKNITIFSVSQVLLFMTGLLFTIICGCCVKYRHEKIDNEKKIELKLPNNLHSKVKIIYQLETDSL